jgi:hypothetical protein
MPITEKVVSENDYKQWLEEEKVKFSKEDLNINIKIAKKIKEIK